MFEQALNNIDDVLWKDAGCTSELDYTEQSSWLLFLKYLDALETDRATAAALNGKTYAHILDKPYRWGTWAAPKGKDPSAGSGQARKVWYYQLDPGRNLGKTNPLNDEDRAEFVKIQKTFADSSKSWSVDAKDIDQTAFDLSVKNPNGAKTVTHRSPKEIMAEIAKLDAESAKVLAKIKRLLGSGKGDPL